MDLPVSLKLVYLPFCASVNQHIKTCFWSSPCCWQMFRRILSYYPSNSFLKILAQFADYHLCQWSVSVDARRNNSNLHCTSCSCTVSSRRHLTTDASTKHSFQTDLKLSHKLGSSVTRKKKRGLRKGRLIVNSICMGLMGQVPEICSKDHHFRNTQNPYCVERGNSRLSTSWPEEKWRRWSSPSRTTFQNHCLER